MSCDGESICGDAAVIVSLEHGLLIGVIDGLGHGQPAYAVSSIAEEWLKSHADIDVAEVADRLSEHLKGTDGAAIGLCFLEHETGLAHFAGIGNTVLRTFGRARESRLVSRDGIAGRTAVRAKAYSTQLQPGDLLLLYSDGISTQFRLEQYPTLLNEEPATLARSIVTRLARRYDDAACIAARWQAELSQAG